MELLDGETLEARRERAGVLGPAEVLFVADKILDVLAAAHPKGIVHRDLKPENIFLCRDGVVKVLDFGIARVREASGGTQTMTNAGPMGTPAYMPPEQARGRWTDVGPRTDIWAMGATMFTLLTGRLVHEAETVNELLLAAMTKPSPRLASVMPGVSTALAGIVDRALAFAPADRWADAATMQGVVRLVLNALAVEASNGGDMELALTAKYVDPPSTGTPPLERMPHPMAPSASPAQPRFAPSPARQPHPSAPVFPAAHPFRAAPPPPAFVAPGVSLAMLALAPAAVMATGHPVTLGPDRDASRAFAPAPFRPGAGFVVLGVAIATLLGAIVVWAAFGNSGSVVPAADPPVAESSFPVVAPPPSASSPPEPSASAASPSIPSASPAASAKVTPEVPVVLKPRPKSEKELLNRRH